MNWLKHTSIFSFGKCLAVRMQRQAHASAEEGKHTLRPGSNWWEYLWGKMVVNVNLVGGSSL